MIPFGDTVRSSPKSRIRFSPSVVRLSPLGGCFYKRFTVAEILLPAIENLSGHWTGFANQGTPDNRRRLDLLLQLRDRRISGVGDDDTGIFVLSGEYDEAAQEFRWVQTYLFGDTLFCRGFFDRKWIWGTWQDATDGHGGFQIWPLNDPDTGRCPTADRSDISPNPRRPGAA